VFPFLLAISCGEGLDLICVVGGLALIISVGCFFGELSGGADDQNFDLEYTMGDVEFPPLRGVG